MSTPPIAPLDGFSYALTIIFAPGRFIPAALGQMEILRKAGGYRSRWYVAPEPFRQLIPAYDTVETRLWIVPGSYLYGFMLTTLDGFNVPILTTDIFVRVREEATGIALMDDFVSGPNTGGGFLPPVKCGWPQLFTEPRLIIEPGWVTVELANASGLALGRTEFTLLTAEPCLVTNDRGQIRPTECRG